jgi:hypothetical protein
MKTYSEEQISKLLNQETFYNPVEEFSGLDNLNEFIDLYMEGLGKLGFKIISMQFNRSTSNDYFYSAHMIILEHDSETPFTIKQIEEAMVDDDNVPLSVFQLYFGTLWVFMPYYH